MASFIKFTTYNLHRLNQGKSMLFDLCGSMDVIAGQEHWLLESETDRISDFHKDFIGIASFAMKHRSEAGLLVGRPHGGLGILVRISLNVRMQVLAVQEDCRCLAESLRFPSNYTVLIFVTYFPCFVAGPECQISFLKCLGFM